MGLKWLKLLWRNSPQSRKAPLANLLMLDILIKSDTRYPVNRKIIRKAVTDTLAKQEIGNISAEVSIAVVGKRKMKMLCDKYLGDGEIHEVLTFPFEEITQKVGRQGFVNPPGGQLVLGDVILCWPQVLNMAAFDDVLVDDEVYLLIAHGMEHLLGKHYQ